MSSSFNTFGSMHNFIVVFVLLVFTQIQALSQVNQGYLKFHVDIDVIDTTAQSLQASSLLRNSKIEMLILGNKYRLNTKMGNLYTSSLIHNTETNETLVLTVNSNGKFAQQYSNDDIEIKPVANDDIVILEYPDSVRSIIGFNCYYVELIQLGDTSSYWCTKEINFEFKGSTIVDKNLPAFPLLIRKKEGGLEFTYTASNFKDGSEITNADFITDVPEGYTLVSK